jgi:hypothetical protein
VPVQQPQGLTLRPVELPGPRGSRYRRPPRSSIRCLLRPNRLCPRAVESRVERNWTRPGSSCCHSRSHHNSRDSDHCRSRGRRRHGSLPSGCPTETSLTAGTARSLRKGLQSKSSRLPRCSRSRGGPPRWWSGSYRSTMTHDDEVGGSDVGRYCCPCLHHGQHEEHVP